jgi:hypothetical protein
MTGGPGSYLFGAEAKTKLMDVIDSGYFFRYGNENDQRFGRKVIAYEWEFAQHIWAPYCGTRIETMHKK